MNSMPIIKVFVYEVEKKVRVTKAEQVVCNNKNKKGAGNVTRSLIRNNVFNEP